DDDHIEQGLEVGVEFAKQGVDADSLEFRFRDRSVHPSESDMPNAPGATGVFDIDTPPATDEIVTVVVHADVTVDMGFAMPPAFDHPPAPLFAWGAQALTITWSNPTRSDQGGWGIDNRLFAACVQGSSPIVSNTGSLRIAAGTLMRPLPPQPLGDP